MPVPTRTPLGASPTNRMWYLDVDTASNPAAPTWVAVMGISEFTPKISANRENDTDFDAAGYQSESKTAEKWSLEGKLNRKGLAADFTSYDPGQEFLRLRAIGQMGAANRVHIRYYEMEPSGPRVEAYDGFAGVDWEPDGGKMTDLSIVSFKLIGMGKLNPITHPNTGAVIPVITALAPITGLAAGGTLVRITGTNFTGVTGATGVKFATNNATSYDVLSDGVIYAIAPAHAAGQVDVAVTNAAGASATSALTKYTYV